MTKTLKCLLISVIGGAACAVLRVPLPWMLGPLFGMAIARMAGSDAMPLKGGRQAGQLIIGCALGQYFTPEVGSYVASNAMYIIGAAFGALLLGYLSGIVLSRIGRVNMITAYFSSLPGGASEMVVLADRFGAQIDRVALAHSLRVLMVVVIIPFGIFWSGSSGSDFYQPLLSTFDTRGFLLLSACAILSGFLFRRFTIPNAWMFGPLFLSMILTLLEYRTSAVPQTVTNAGQLLIGSSLGACFMPGFMRDAPRFVTGVAVSVFVSLGIAGAIGLAVSFAGGIPLASALLATAPGGMSEMCITAKVLRLGVPLITSFHVMRLVFLMLLSGTAVRIARRAAGRGKSAAESG